MKKRDEFITNETIKKSGLSNFDLTRYAILIGRHRIRAGQPSEVSDILTEIRKHPDPAYIEELALIEQIEEKDEE